MLSLIRLHPLINKEVKNLFGEELGSIVDLIIDVKSGQLCFAIFALKSGAINQLYRIDWSAFILNRKEHALVLNMSREEILKAPGFTTRL